MDSQKPSTPVVIPSTEPTITQPTPTEPTVPTAPTEPNTPTIPPPPPNDDSTEDTKSTKSDGDDDDTDTHSSHHDDEICLPYPDCPPPPHKRKNKPIFVPITAEISPIVNVLVNRPKFCLQNKADTKPCYFLDY